MVFDIHEPDTDKQMVFNKFIRELSATASIVVEVAEGKFLLYDFRDDTFMLLDAMQEPMNLSNVRLKHI